MRHRTRRAHFRFFVDISFPFFFSSAVSQPVTTRCGQGNWGLTCATNRVRRLSPEVPNVRRFTICSPGQGDSYRPPVSRTAPTRAGNIYMCHYLHPCGPPPRRRGGIVAHDDRRPHGCRLNWRGVTDQSGVLMFPFRPTAVRARRWIAREALCHRSAAHRGRIVTDIATCMQLRLSTLTTGSTGSRQQWHRTTSSGVSSAAASGFPSASGEFSASPGAARRRLSGTAFACDRALRVCCLPGGLASGARRTGRGARGGSAGQWQRGGATSEDRPIDRVASEARSPAVVASAAVAGNQPLQSPRAHLVQAFPSATFRGTPRGLAACTDRYLILKILRLRLAAFLLCVGRSTPRSTCRWAGRAREAEYVSRCWREGRVFTNDLVLTYF